MRTLMLTAAAAVTATAIAAPAVSAPKTVTLTAKMTGAQERPTPGDPDGSGKAVIRLNAAKRTVCYNLTVRRINGSSAAHIHTGAKGVPGPILVGLFSTATTRKEIKGCARNVPAADIKAITAKPRDYYVNVHNADFPGGAIRGQLRK